MKSTKIFVLIVLGIFIYFLSGCEEKLVANKTISVKDARRQVRLYESYIPESRDSLQNQAKLRSFYYKSETFSKNDIKAVLNQKNCTGIRVYHGIDKNGKAVLLIVGVSDSTDIVPAAPIAKRKQTEKEEQEVNKEDVIILTGDELVRCPDVCPVRGL